MKTEAETPEQPDVFNRALEQFNDITQPTLLDRALSLEDRRFVFIEGAQWDGDWGAQFENSIRVQSNKVQRGHDKVINDYRANRFTVNFRPVGDDGDDDTAELLNGLIYADIYRSKGQQALDNAFSEGAAGGFGAFRLCNEYEDESDPDNDHQRIGVYQIVDADQRVFFDLDAKLYDKSDARFAYVLNSMTPAAFKREYGEERICTWPDNMLPQNWFEWFRPNVVFVAEYYEVEYVTRELRIYTRDLTGEEERLWAEDMADGADEDLIKRGFTKRARKIKRKRVHKWIMSGAEVLEDCGFIAGPRIPIIPFYGKRVFIDNIERFKGHVRDAKDMQRTYNAQISKLVETSSLSPRELPIFAPEQMEGQVGEHWARSNIERHAYLLAHPLIDPITGSIVQTGPTAYVKPPDLPPVLAALMQQTAGDIAEITNGDDGSMEIKSNVSGEAMDIAASRVDAKSYIYMDNWKNTIQCFGEVYYGMACEVYPEEGRKVEVQDEEGATSTKTLGETYTNPNTQVTAKRHDLSVGKFNVVADVTEATATRRDKTVRTMMTFSQAAVTAQDLGLAKAALLVVAKNMDGEGIEDFKDYSHKQAVGIGLEEPTPEEAAAKAQQEQQPDPASLVALGQAKALNSQALNLDADTEKKQADTEQSRAKTVQILADAKLKGAQTERTGVEADQIANQPATPDVHEVNKIMSQAA